VWLASNDTKVIASFHNLGGDAALAAPISHSLCQVGAYPHLAPKKQQLSFEREIAAAWSDG